MDGLRRGDRDAFDALFDRYFASVWRGVVRGGVEPELQPEVARAVLRRFFASLVSWREHRNGPDPAAVGLALLLLELDRRGIRDAPGEAGAQAGGEDDEAGAGLRPRPALPSGG